MLTFKEYLNEICVKEQSNVFYLLPSKIEKHETYKIEEVLDCLRSLLSTCTVIFHKSNKKNKFFKEHQPECSNLDNHQMLSFIKTRILTNLTTDDFNSVGDFNNSKAYIFIVKNYSKRFNLIKTSKRDRLYVKFKFSSKVSNNIRNGITLQSPNEEFVMVNPNSIIEIVSIHYS